MGVYIGTSGELSNAYIGIPNPESIVLDKSSITLTTVGQTEQLTATVGPTISDHSVTWSTSDGTIATVSTSGLVTCVTPGTATITATTVNGLTASCSVGTLQIPTMTANSQDGYTASGSSLLGGGTDRYNAFNTTGLWHSASIGSGGWAYSQIQMPKTVKVTKLYLTSRADDPNRPQYPDSIYLQGSNDGSSWTNIGSTITPGFTDIGQEKSWDITGETTGYSYLRLYLQAGVSGYVAMNNWNVEGTAS